MFDNVRQGSTERRDFLHGGAEFFQFVVRVAAMDRFRLVAGELHPHFRRNALIRQRTREAMPQRMERAPG